MEQSTFLLKITKVMTTVLFFFIFNLSLLHDGAADFVRDFTDWYRSHSIHYI